MDAMKHVSEPAREVPVVDEVDVLVLGSGPAGVSAAIQAGREGMKTLLVEQCGDVGGISTAGLMSHWTGNTRGGIYEEILDRSCEANGPQEGIDFNGGMRQVINPERLKTAYLEMLAEAGVGLSLYSLASQPVMDGNTIKGVIIEGKSGRQAILAKVVVDATGDGDIAARAGVPFVLGRESDHRMQPATLMFKVAGVDTQRAVFPGAFEDHIQIPLKDKPLLGDGSLPTEDIQKLGKENLPAPSGHVLLYRTTLPGVVTCNMTNCIGIDGTQTRDLTRATVECRLQMDRIIDFLRTYVPGFENCYVMTSASLIGIRETRHFQGEETITEDDILAARVFPDWVVTKASFNFDVHNMTGNGLDETGVQKGFTQKNGYTIPYGCFVPKVVDNLYLAGRNISGTHMAHSNFRVMPICANMGQAVGIAASLCVKGAVKPRDLDYHLVQERLIQLGVEP